jgi:cytoskeletal protein CcmA (bactofilin family)
MLFGKKKTPQTFTTDAPVERVTTVLGPGISWKGDLRGKGGVRIEGALEGEISIRGMVIIGETGRVTSETIRADSVVVAGVVNGKILSEKLEIRATGRVYGDVTAKSFSTEEGAFLRGKVTMEDNVDLSDLPSGSDEEEVPQDENPPAGDEV